MDARQGPTQELTTLGRHAGFVPGCMGTNARGNQSKISDGSNEPGSATFRMHMRGRHVLWDEAGLWRWESTGDPVVASSVDPSCAFCDLPLTVDGCDPCIGRVSGAIAACCGHGVRVVAPYVVFRWATPATSLTASARRAASCIDETLGLDVPHAVDASARVDGSPPCGCVPVQPRSAAEVEVRLDRVIVRVPPSLGSPAIGRLSHLQELRRVLVEYATRARPATLS